MKTAISIDNALFNLAENTAYKLGITRSKLSSCAIKEYIECHNAQNITNKLNDYYKTHCNRLPKNIEHAQFSSVDFGDW